MFDNITTATEAADAITALAARFDLPVKVWVDADIESQITVKLSKKKKAALIEATKSQYGWTSKLTECTDAEWAAIDDAIEDAAKELGISL